ncbi:MAG: NAD(P)-binding protein [bacterium]
MSQAHTNRNVVVVGAGISGLVAAYELLQKAKKAGLGLNITLF